MLWPLILTPPSPSSQAPKSQVQPQKLLETHAATPQPMLLLPQLKAAASGRLTYCPCRPNPSCPAWLPPTCGAQVDTTWVWGRGVGGVGPLAVHEVCSLPKELPGQAVSQGFLRFDFLLQTFLSCVEIPAVIHNIYRALHSEVCKGGETHVESKLSLLGIPWNVRRAAGLWSGAMKMPLRWPWSHTPSPCPQRPSC